MLIMKLSEVGNIKSYAAHVHELNKKWWYDKEGNPIEETFHIPTRINLMVSEVSEGFEAFRKNAKDDHLPQYPGLWAEMADVVIRLLDSCAAFGWELISPAHLNWFEPKTTNDYIFQLTDYIMYLSHVVIDGHTNWFDTPGAIAHRIILRAENIAHREGCPDFWQVVYDKLCYNWSRIDHTYEARAAEGGKKF